MAKGRHFRRSSHISTYRARVVNQDSRPTLQYRQVLAGDGYGFLQRI
nr:MAG TPA: hypothetical protein [Caudoviricetes sp.]